MQVPLMQGEGHPELRELYRVVLNLAAWPRVF